MDKIYLLMENSYNFLLGGEDDIAIRAYRDKAEAKAEASKLNEAEGKWGNKYYIVTIDLI